MVDREKVNDLISRAAAIEAFTGKPPEYYHTSYIVGELNSVPAVDAVPVVHGRWIFHDDDIMPWVSSSECGICTDSTNKTSYCPNCGAKMDGERRDSDA